MRRESHDRRFGALNGPLIAYRLSTNAMSEDAWAAHSRHRSRCTIPYPMTIKLSSGFVQLKNISHCMGAGPV
jgi:hypothetical protein